MLFRSLVLTGTASREDVAGAPIAPDLVIDDLGGLVAGMAAPGADGAEPGTGSERGPRGVVSAADVRPPWMFRQ